MHADRMLSHYEDISKHDGIITADDKGGKYLIQRGENGLYVGNYADHACLVEKALIANIEARRAFEYLTEDCNIRRARASLEPVHGYTKERVWGEMLPPSYYVLSPELIKNMSPRETIHDMYWKGIRIC